MPMAETRYGPGHMAQKGIWYSLGYSVLYRLCGIDTLLKPRVPPSVPLWCRALCYTCTPSHRPCATCAIFFLYKTLPCPCSGV